MSFEGVGVVIYSISLALHDAAVAGMKRTGGVQHAGGVGHGGGVQHLGRVGHAGSVEEVGIGGRGNNLVVFEVQADVEQLGTEMLLETRSVESVEGCSCRDDQVG